MKYIYKILFIGALTLTLLTVSSCNKFLDVRPVGELPSDQLLKDAQGFESALFGAYASLNNKALYGEKLSHEMIEILAQYFHVSGNEFVTSLVKYDYSHSLVESAVNEVWGKMYKNISNVNNVIISLEKFSPESLRYYNIYKGEALGLRAFMHFDLLRLFLDGAQGETQDVGIPYSTKFELTPSAIISSKEVYALIKECVEEANADVARDEQLSGLQLHRFLILHKELDPDDGELTRTRKVRRNFIVEKYGVLIDALFEGKPSQYIETEVRYEDGRIGKISADLKIESAKVVAV